MKHPHAHARTRTHTLSFLTGVKHTHASLSSLFSSQGEQTLDEMLRSRDFPLDLEAPLLGRSSGTHDHNGHNGRKDRSGSEAELEARAAKIVRRLSGQIFEDLAAVHSHHVVHRDVKGSSQGRTRCPPTPCTLHAVHC